MRKLAAIIITLSIMCFLLIGLSESPSFGDPNNISNNHLSTSYIQRASVETGAANIVSAVILDYRAFDTFIEATVLFTGLTSILAVLKKSN